MTPEIKYYESHITFSPILDETDLSIFEHTVKIYGFKPAKLLMVKDRPDVLERSNKDTFCTGHGKDYDELLCTTKLLANVLAIKGFKIWRYKIEGILFDERF